MTGKIKVGILFGGKSAEHEISLQSARSVFSAIDLNKFDVFLIGIDKSGKWSSCSPDHLEAGITSPSLGKGAYSSREISLLPGRDAGLMTGDGRLAGKRLDVVFPVLHGTYGEDGTIQGLLKLLGIPFVGAGVLGSSVGMDKDVSKRLLCEAEIPVADCCVVHRSRKETLNLKALIEKLKLPLFIKPANLGSSVGIRKVLREQELEEAMDFAFKYDSKILVEEFIEGRELEVSVLGNEIAEASVPGEIIPADEFYSYKAKYLDENGATLEIPAQLSAKQIAEIQTLAVKTFETLCCEGMARVDFFLTKREKLIVNEINTIPGFTSISMYPKLWEASGLSYTDLITKLIELALQRYEKEKNLVTDFNI